MESFTWDACFITGQKRVDEQHHRLVDLINRFGTLAMQVDGASRDDIEQVFAELAGYAQEHFREEEELMRQAALDPRHRDEHGQEHQRFLQELGRLHAAAPAAGRLLQFMTDWLAYHILGSDQAMAAQLAAVAAGQTAAQAFADRQHTRDPATVTLLHALDRLFRHVSDRNRELFDLNRTLEARVEERTRELSESNRRLQEMALSDPLTGLANRRHAMRRLQHEWQQADAACRPLACVMMDADGFKGINDRFGHDAGDAVLQQLAQRLGVAVRNDDTVCRLGGDEFLVICANTTLRGALETADKLRRAVSSSPMKAGAGTWQGSISVGVAVRDGGMGCVEDLLKAADAALYTAKREGRNRVATPRVGTPVA